MRAELATTSDPELGVTARAAIRRVTRRACARLGTGLERVARLEAGAMDRRREWIFEVRGCRQNRHGLAVTLGAELIAVTRSAQIARRRSARAVLAQPIAFVREMRLGQRRRVFEPVMARVAFARVARGIVIVAAKAGRHRRTQMLIAFGNADVTAHAIALARRCVLRVIEHEVRARVGELADRVRGGVTVEARMRVVRFCVARRARRRVGEMQRAAVVAIEPGMTRRAWHAGDGMRAMRERLRTVMREAEYAGACGESGDHERERDALHFVPHVRPSCASTSSRLRSSGDACASSAIAACHGPQLRLNATSAHGHTRPNPRS